MAELTVSASADIAAPAEAIYALLADYQTGHPSILPLEHFPSLVVEEGGVGAGTVLRATARAAGRERTIRMVVAEPEPGRLLTETDDETGLVTSYTVDALGPNRSRLTIATQRPARPGPAGWLEALLAPPLLRRVFRKILVRVAGAVKEG